MFLHVSFTRKGYLGALLEWKKWEAYGELILIVHGSTTNEHLELGRWKLRNWNPSNAAVSYSSVMSSASGTF